jgi:hypothetical protein
MEKGFFHKNQVPAGSTLLVTVSPAAPPPAPDLWDALLVLSRKDGTTEATFSNEQLRAGIEHVLSGDSSRYSGPLVLTFAGASDARVEMKVQKPGSTQHGDAYDFVHSAAPADAISIRLRMA